MAAAKRDQALVAANSAPVVRAQFPAPQHVNHGSHRGVARYVKSDDITTEAQPILALASATVRRDHEPAGKWAYLAQATQAAKAKQE